MNQPFLFCSSAYSVDQTVILPDLKRIQDDGEEHLCLDKLTLLKLAKV